jgi:hypothetical protein
MPRRNAVHDDEHGKKNYDGRAHVSHVSISLVVFDID